MEKLTKFLHSAITLNDDFLYQQFFDVVYTSTEKYDILVLTKTSEEKS